MTAVRQKLSVRFEYDVLFVHRIFDPANDALARVFAGTPARAVFFVDDGVHACWPEMLPAVTEWCTQHPDVVELAAPVEVVAGGEQIKNSLDILDTVGNTAARLGLDRRWQAGH